MQIRSINSNPVRAAAAFLALSLTLTAAYAQMEPMAPMTPPATKPGASALAAKPLKSTARSNAELEQEIKSLRAQVQQLQQAHGMITDKQPGAVTQNRDEAIPPATAPMKQDCMGKGCTEKGDDAMGMPPPNGADSQPMPGAMPHM